MSARKPEREKKSPSNPIATAVQGWLLSARPQGSTESGGDGEPVKALVEQAPKRWVAYSPMVLLPSGSFTSPAWDEVLGQCAQSQRDELWMGILDQISKKSGETFTHLATNEGIPLKVSRQGAPGLDSNVAGDSPGENILRSPSGLKILHGDFGPSEIVGDSATEADFAKALWVSTKQNGIHQTWAPRWTMFSRGNVKEKARLLDFHDGLGSASNGVLLHHRVRSRADLKDRWAVDLYGGIGYFVFSYAKLGMRVLCWELNPWSVEGLRRGALRNGWSVKVVKGHGRKAPISDIMAGQETIIVFQEDNQEAGRRIRAIRDMGTTVDICHVNCGLLPRSDGSWKTAWDIMRQPNDGWLHLHENVGTHDISQRQAELHELFDGWGKEISEYCKAEVEYVELVKTFAPDVWHCVFDVYIKNSSNDDT